MLIRVLEVEATAIEEMEQVNIVVRQGLQPDDLQNLADSMTNRLEATIDAKAGPNGD
jgi:hypothetical protein